MHGLVYRAFERFVREIYGSVVWNEIVDSAEVPFDTFEAMLVYPDGIGEMLVSAVERKTGRHAAALLEDMGTFLISHPSNAALRRLLRFGGTEFEDLLLSLDELPDRARLAVSDLELPEIVVSPSDGQRVTISSGRAWDGFAHVLAGALRALADDYGALVLIDVLKSGSCGETLHVTIHDRSFASGRSFSLAGGF